MSLESAKAFVKKMQEDDEFAKSFFACSDPEGRAGFIKEQGYDFTKEEADEAREGIDISGGKCCGHTCEDDHCIQEGCKAIQNPPGYFWTR